jgi:hypothetical protein
MLGAYILGGELKRAAGDHQVAFSEYERTLRRFIEKKQRAAESFSRSFALRTKLEIYARNHVTDLMSLPFVARFALGRLLTDSLRLPRTISPEPAANAGATRRENAVTGTKRSNAIQYVAKETHSGP